MGKTKVVSRWRADFSCGHSVLYKIPPEFGDLVLCARCWEGSYVMRLKYVTLPADNSITNRNNRKERSHDLDRYR